MNAVVAAAVGVAGVALGDIDLHFARQAWHLATSASTSALRGRRGTWRHRRSLCVAGVASSRGVLGSSWFHFAWQWRAWFPVNAVAWHFETWTFTLRGSCGTYGTGLHASRVPLVS